MPVCAAASSSSQGESKLSLWALAAACPELRYFQAPENNLYNYTASVFFALGFFACVSVYDR